MQVLVLLLSTSLVFGAVYPAKREAVPEQDHWTRGPHCYDKKDHKCRKIPKDEEHDECEHIIDTIMEYLYLCHGDGQEIEYPEPEQNLQADTNVQHPHRTPDTSKEEVRPNTTTRTRRRRPA